MSSADSVHPQHLGRSVNDAGVCGVRALLVLLLGGVKARFGSQGAALLLQAHALLLGGSRGQDGGAAEHGAAGGCGGERGDVLGRRAQLVLLLQGHGVPQGHVVVHERAGLAARERVAQHERVTRVLREGRVLHGDAQRGARHHPPRRGVGGEAEGLGDPESGAHRPLGGGGHRVVRGQRVLEQVSV